MTATKEQERKALAQIRKIVEGLGENSYIGTAFDGCFEDAETNIENDFAFSWKQRAEGRLGDANYWKKRYDALNENFEACKEEMEKNRATFKTENDRLNKQIAYDDQQLDTALKNAETAYGWYSKEKETTAELEKKIAEQAQTIIELKAKLYDLITAK